MEWAAIGSLLKACAAVLVGVPLAAYLFQDRLIFHPQPSPAVQVSGADQRFIEAPDGTRIHAWHVSGVPGAPLILYFGGNAEDVSWMARQARAQIPGPSWLLVDYRGYGASEGKPSERALVSDALAWYDFAQATLAPKEVVVFGRSLGSGVAVQVAASRPVSRVILVAPYASLVGVAQHHYPFLPVRWLLRHRFDSGAAAPDIRAPLLCLVAERDEVIPIVHSKELFGAWAGPKRWVELRGAGHNSTDEAPAFWEAIKEFLVRPS